MKQAQNARKQRGRSASRKGGKGNGGGNRNNEPKVRGNPKQLLEKYKMQAREAKQAGDRVQAEYFYQFADHYQRVLNEVTARNGGGQARDDKGADKNAPDAEQDNGKQRRGRGRRQRGQEEAVVAAEADAQAPQADIADAEQPVEVHPELDLDGTESEKPKRRRAPQRRRKTPPKDEEQAEATLEASPEDNAAA